MSPLHIPTKRQQKPLQLEVNSKTGTSMMTIAKALFMRKLQKMVL